MTTPQPAPSPPPTDSGIRVMLLRSSALAWMASAVLIVIAGVVMAAWLYTTIRQQLQLGDDSGFSGPFDDGVGAPSFLDRLDLATTNLFYLAEGGVVAGAGFGLRVVGDLAAVRAGGPAATEITLEGDDGSS